MKSLKPRNYKELITLVFISILIIFGVGLEYSIASSIYVRPVEPGWNVAPELETMYIMSFMHTELYEYPSDLEDYTLFVLDISSYTGKTLSININPINSISHAAAIFYGYILSGDRDVMFDRKYYNSIEINNETLNCSVNDVNLDVLLIIMVSDMANNDIQLHYRLIEM